MDWIASFTRDRFNWAELQAFRDVARTGSFRGAAIASEMSINTIRSRVRHLEKLSGRPLFERSVQGSIVTPHGKTLLDRVDRMAAALANDLP